jgi:hypothetical protein
MNALKARHTELQPHSFDHAWIGLFTGWNPYGCIKKCQQNFNLFHFERKNNGEFEEKIIKKSEKAFRPIRAFMKL